MKKKETSILWWIGWIALTIASFFVSCYFWTGWIAKHVGPLSQKGTVFFWVLAVFGTWLALLIPLIIVMYSKVDKAYEDSRLAREEAQRKKSLDDYPARLQSVTAAQRRLRPEVSKKVKGLPETIRQGHLVKAILRDGRIVDYVFVAKKTEVLGVYDRPVLDFSVQDIVDVELYDREALPDFKVERWLRFYSPEEA